jgi:carbon monoxide dehydrogenase subunit G
MPRFEQSIKIDAPMDKVWAMFLDPGTWGSWFPGVDTVTGMASVSEGATFQWQEKDETGSGTVVAVDDKRGLIKVVTNDAGKQVTHTFDLDRAGFLGFGNDTKVTYIREFDSGGLIGEFISGGNPADALSVKRTLEKIKRVAQG